MTTKFTPPKKTMPPGADDVLQDVEKQELGKRIKKLREESVYTLDELSQITKQIDPLGDGVSKVSISRYENGDSYPGYREIRLIAQALGEPITFFFYGEKPDPFGEWSMSLDEYLRSIIRDELIENGLMQGRSIAQREQDKRRLLRQVNSLREPLRPDTDPEAVKWKEERRKQDLEKLLQEAKKIESPKRKQKE